MGKFSGYWPMREGGPKEKGREVFKCTGCNATSRPVNGHSGAPDLAACKPGCRNHDHAAGSDWRPAGVSDDYRNNYRRIFGHD